MKLDTVHLRLLLTCALVVGGSSEAHLEEVWRSSMVGEEMEGIFLRSGEEKHGRIRRSVGSTTVNHSLPTNESEMLDPNTVENNLTDDCQPIMEQLTCKHAGLTTLPTLGNMSLRFLDLSNNNISALTPGVFKSQSVLQTLNLSFNQIRVLREKTFKGLDSVTILDLSHNNISKLYSKCFVGLSALETLYIAGNPIRSYMKSSFLGLTALKLIHTDDPSIMCVAKTPMMMLSVRCKDVLPSNTLKALTWTAAGISCIGNMAVVARTGISGDLTHPSSILLVNLAISDWLMCGYQYLVAIADTAFRGVYERHDDHWRHGPVCTVAGVLATLSKQASMFFLLPISIERLTSALMPSLKRKWRLLLVCVNITAVWLLALLVAVIPVLNSSQNLYSATPQCLPLPLTARGQTGWEYALSVFVVMDGLAIVVSVAFSIVSLVIKAKNKQNSTNENDFCQNQQQTESANALVFILFLDAFCWVPTMIMIAMSPTGIPMPVWLADWVQVLLVPLSSTINPWAYLTLTLLPKLCASPGMRAGPGGKTPSLRRSRGMRRSRCESIPNVLEQNGTRNDHADNGLELAMVVQKVPLSEYQTLRHGTLRVADIHKMMLDLEHQLQALRTDGTPPPPITEQNVLVHLNQQKHGELSFSLVVSPGGEISEPDQGDSEVELASLIALLMAHCKQNGVA